MILWYLDSYKSTKVIVYLYFREPLNLLAYKSKWRRNKFSMLKFMQLMYAIQFRLDEILGTIKAEYEVFLFCERSCATQLNNTMS